MGRPHVCQHTFLEQIKLQAPACAREIIGNVLHGMDEGWAFPDKECGFSGGIHENSHHASGPSARSEHCSQVNRFCRVGNGVGLPFGSWLVLLREQTSVFLGGQKKESCPCSLAHQNTREQTLNANWYPCEMHVEMKAYECASGACVCVCRVCYMFVGYVCVVYAWNVCVYGIWGVCVGGSGSHIHFGPTLYGDLGSSQAPLFVARPLYMIVKPVY